MTGKTSRLWTIQFVMVIFSTFVFFMCLQSLTAGFPVFVTDISGSSSQGGLMTTFFMLGAIITRPFIGVLIHKINIKMTLLCTLVLVVVVLLLSLHQQTFGVLVILRLLQGVGFGTGSTLLATAATNLIPTRRLGEGIGYFGMATSLGTSIAPMLALTVIHQASFNWLLILTAALGFITFIGSLFIKNADREPTGATPKPKGSLLSYAFDKKAFLPSFLVMLFYITFSGIVNFIDGLGQESHMQGQISLFFLVTAIAMVVIRPFSGRIYDIVGHKVLVIPAALCGVVGLLLLSNTQGAGMLVLAAIFYGIAYGVIQPTLQAWAVSRVAPDKKATANAMALNFMDLGMAVGAASLGAVADVTGYHKMFGASSILVILLIVIYSVLFISRQTKVRKLNEQMNVK